MPRRARSIAGGYSYHVLNRSNARATLFKKRADYEAFERVLEQAFERVPLRILSYCVIKRLGLEHTMRAPGRPRQASTP